MAGIALRLRVVRGGEHSEGMLKDFSGYHHTYCHRAYDLLAWDR